MTQRDFDVVLYGTSGFTGKQTAQYFAAHVPPGSLRWALAGRNRAKLEAVKRELGAVGQTLEIIVADSTDAAALETLASRTRVVLTTAGPFALYGSALVAACVRQRTHYVDITGETPWVRDLIDRHHAQAAADGTRIIPFCGFDSVPSDLGSFLLVEHARRELGVGCRWIKAFFQMQGGLNGGTLATVFHLVESGQAARARDLFLLSPGYTPSRDELVRSQDPRGPQFVSAVNAWTAPFVMGAINTRVVRRSAWLAAQAGAAYGPEFSYQEFQKFSGPLGWLPAAGLSSGGAVFEALLHSPFRAALKPLLPAPGAGPSERTMNEGWFRCELVGETTDGRQLRGQIKDQGDPGNRATVKFLCEAALALALDFGELPGGAARGGVLTPATGLGEVLARRLRAAGMTIEVSG